jgi:hypothetical protein
MLYRTSAAILLAITMTGLGSAVLAQETLLVRPVRAATPDSPVVDVVVWANFADRDYAFSGAQWDMEAADGEFLRGYCLGGVCDPRPIPDGSRIFGMRAVQLHFPPAGIFADPSNPIAVAVAEWRPTGFATEDVAVVTFDTRSFSVFIDERSSVSESRLDTFEEGAGIVRVRRCYTDCDGDDAASVFDFLCFFNAFQAGDFYADCDASGELDLFDFLCFQQEFMDGCP